MDFDIYCYKIKNFFMNMDKHLQLFDNHSSYETKKEKEMERLASTINDYDTFVQAYYLTPNVSHCVNENDVHYNPKPYFTMTPKEIMECLFNFAESCFHKYMEYGEQCDFNDRFTNMYEINLSTYNQLFTRLNGIRIRNINIEDMAGDLTISQELLGEQINLWISMAITVNASFISDGIDGDVELRIRRLNEWNNNDVFVITYEEITSTTQQMEYDEFEEFNNKLRKKLEYGDIVFLLPKSVTHAETSDLTSYFQLAYKDGNGGYTTTKPTSFDIDLTVDSIYIYPEFISYIFFHSRFDDIDERADETIITQRNNIIESLRGDFSALSAIDDVKIPLTYTQKEILKNPWKYYKEKHIFSEKKVIFGGRVYGE